MSVIYASFADAALAEKAAGALMDFGVREEDLSILANEQYGQTRGLAASGTGYAAPNGTNFGDGAANAGDSVVDATKYAGNRTAEAGDRAMGAAAGAAGATGTAANYQAAAGQRSFNAEARGAMAQNEDVVHGRGGTATVERTDNADYDPVDAAQHKERAAKAGISTTTGADAGVAAAEGAGIGLGLGVIGGIASLAIPGFGLVLGGGALALAAIATAGTAAAGAITGGVWGYLKEQGVPADVATDYDAAVKNGGAILSVNVPSGNVGAATATELISKYNGINVRTY